LIDTNVLFSAVLKRAGVPAQILDLVAGGVLTPCVSDAVMAAYLDVLAGPFLKPHAARTRELLKLMVAFAVHVSPTGTLSLCSDPDDGRFLECALAAKTTNPSPSRPPGNSSDI
jgi:uncharacterized protein